MGVRVAPAVVVCVLVVAAAAVVVVVAVPFDEAESRQDEGPVVDEEFFADAAVNATGDTSDLGDEIFLEDLGNVDTTPPGASVGNVVYSVVGFALGGLLLFASLYDGVRQPIVSYFDFVFGAREMRRRREASTGLEARVASAFQAVTSALDKMEAIAKLVN